MHPAALDNLNSLWSEPSANWFDYFVNRPRLAALLENRNLEKDKLAQLCLQFTEQAANSEREAEVLSSKKFESEDVQFMQRKAACQWLCSLSCLAALDYNIDMLLDKYGDVVGIRPLVDRVLRVWSSSDITADNSFGEWLYGRWVLSVHSRYRIPPPPAKPTVSNPMSLHCANTARHEHIRKMVAEMREHVQRTVEAMEMVAMNGKEMTIPTYKCFFLPFMKIGSNSMAIALEGENVLFPEPPQPDFSMETSILPNSDVANQARFELLNVYVADGNFVRAQYHLKALRQPISSHHLVSLDCDMIAGYCSALRVAEPFNLGVQPLVGPTEEHYQKIFLDDQAKSRSRYSFRRWKAEREAGGQMQVALRAENAARDASDARPTALRHKLDSSVAVERFVKSLLRQLSSLPPYATAARRRIEALIFFLSTCVMGMKETLHRSGVPPAHLQHAPPVTVKPSPPIPLPAVFKALMRSDSASWTLYTSFDYVELKEAYTIVQHQHTQTQTKMQMLSRMRLPELLAEHVMNVRPAVNIFHTILLGKLQQLCRLGNKELWQAMFNAVLGEISYLLAQFNNSVIYEGFRMTIAVQNQSMHLAGAPFDQAITDQNIRTMKRLVELRADNGDWALSPASLSVWLKEVFVFALNAREWDFIYQKIETTVLPKLSPVAKMMGVFAVHYEAVDIISKLMPSMITHMMTILEVQTSKRKADGANQYRENARARIDLVVMLKNVRDSKVLDVFLSLCAFIFNRILLADKKPQLKVFVPHAEYFPSETEVTGINVDCVEEMLRTVLINCQKSHPSHVGWLRTAADYRYAINELEEAGTLYMEVVVAARIGTVSKEVITKAIDDTLWQRLRVCLSKQKCHTLGALCVQMMKHTTDVDYARACQLLVRDTCLDGRSECAQLISDLTLAEYIHDAYEKSRQQGSADQLLSWMSRPAMNAANRADILANERARRNARLEAVLAALLFGLHF